MKETIEQAVRKYVDNHPNNKMKYPEWDGADAYDAFVAGAAWQAKQSPWISVAERLPVERLDKEVSSSALSELVFIRAWSYGHELIGTCKRENGKWADPFPGVQKDSYTITHWMPIPE